MKTNSESGFTLLELTVAAMLTVGLVGAVSALMNKNQQVFVTESSVTDLNENIRTAVDYMTRDIQSAGMGLPRPNSSFAGLFYNDGVSAAPDQLLMVNGDPYAPNAYIDDPGGASPTFTFPLPSEVTVTGTGSNARFTYFDQHARQARDIYEAFSTTNRYYICYDDKKAIVFALTSNGQFVGGKAQLSHDTSNAMNRAGTYGTSIDQLFSTPVDAGEPSYANAQLAVLGGLVAYRVNQTTKELERTEDLNNWYGIARGITDLQVVYRTVTGTAANPINNVTSAPGDRTTIRSATITISAETPDLPPGNKGYRQAVQTFEVAPRNLNLLRNNNLSANTKGTWAF
jgi:Tfp pilus assembly protein PilW